jgi:hypothetical protein
MININNNKDVYMSRIGNKVLQISLIDAIKRQRDINDELHKLPKQGQLHKLVAEQTRLMKETLSLFDRMI